MFEFLSFMIGIMIMGPIVYLYFSLQELKKRIKSQIYKLLSPRHVPKKIIQVTDIPRTKNGKIVELAVKNIVEGNEIKNIQALANPNVLDEFKKIEELKN